AGNGTGGFQSGTGAAISNNWSNFDVISSPGDFSGDGKPDVIARHSGTKDLHLYEGDGVGGFKSGTGTAISNNWSGYDIIAGGGRALRTDFDGDTRPDVLARNAQTKGIHLYAGNGTGGFLSGTGAAISNNWSDYDMIFSPGDFNGDTRPDILARNASTKNLHLYAGDGNGGFLSGTGAAISNNWSDYDMIFSAGDFNGDTRPDVLARNKQTKDLHLYAGDGTGGFLSGTGAAISNNWSDYDMIFSPGDFNGDTRPDILARNISTKNLHLYAGDGTGGFLPGTGAAISNNWSDYDMIFSPGDFNGDGSADVLARNAKTTDLHLYAGNGSGGFLSGTGAAFSNTWANRDIIVGSSDPSRGIVSVYGWLTDGRLTYTTIESGTGDRTSTVLSTATLPFTPKAMATLNANTILMNSADGHLYRVDVTANSPSLTFAAPADLGSGWGSLDLLTYDGNGHLYGIIKSTGTLRRYDIGATKPTAANITNYSSIATGFGSFTTLTSTGPDWLLMSNSAGLLRSYKIMGVGSWTGYTLDPDGWGFTHLISPGGGYYYGRTSDRALYHYLDANPYDGNGTDIRYFLDDPVDTSGWTQALLSAQPFGS
ncbi:FG-GAP repeat domain-containing protein, partial [Micromonospora sp. NPDC003776]